MATGPGRLGMALAPLLALALALLAACGPGAADAPARLARDAAATNTALAGASGPAPPPVPGATATAPGAPPTATARRCCLRPAAPAASPPAPGAPLPLEVRDTLYAPGAGYALLLVHNPNPDLGLHRSPYRAALRGADGRLLGVSEQGLPGSLDQTIFVLPPGGTVLLQPRFAPAPLAPAGIELIAPPAAHFQRWPADQPRAEVAVTEVRPGRIATASGQARNPLPESANIIVEIALFDEAGRLVNGAQDVVEAVPAGGAKPFQVPLLGDVTAARVEAQARPARLPGLQDHTGATRAPGAPPALRGIPLPARVVAPMPARRRLARLG